MIALEGIEELPKWLCRPDAPGPGVPCVEERRGHELLQRAGYPHHAARWVFGGPACRRDIRIAIDRRSARAIERACCASTTQRAECALAALYVEQLVGMDGHAFQRWTPLAARVAPEPALLVGEPPLPPVEPGSTEARLHTLGGTPIEALLAPPQAIGMKPSRGPRRLHHGTWSPRPELAPRWIFEARGIHALLEAAEASLSGRALLHGGGVQVDLYVSESDRGPAPWELWRLLSGGPPEVESNATG